MTTFSENLAHFVHGAAFMFFVSTGLRLRSLRGRSSMMKILYRSMVFLAFLELKDICFLIPGVWAIPYVSNLVTSLDMLYVPVMALFMFEVISPGWVNPLRSAAMILPSALLLAAYALFPRPWLYTATFVYAALFGFTVMVIVFLAGSRYDNYIKNNFSQIDDLSVAWIRKVIVALFVCLTLWTLLVWRASWLGDAAYYAVSVVVWMLIYRFSCKHAVVVQPGTLKIFPSAESGRPDPPAGEVCPFAGRLRSCMEDDRLFLNPRLTLAEAAAAVGTNRTYLSDYLNRHLHTTFYEYVNAFRVEEARTLLSSGDRRPLAEVAEMSGFNSLSTFNRAFVKATGCTPARYIRKHPDGTL